MYHTEVGEHIILRWKVENPKGQLYLRRKMFDNHLDSDVLQSIATEGSDEFTFKGDVEITLGEMMPGRESTMLTGFLLIAKQ